MSSLALAIGSSGCATGKTQTPGNKPGSGVAEYRRIVVHSMDVINETMESLNELTAVPNAKSFKEFAEEVHRLEVDSVEIRARAQAMEARGDAYFAQWQERLTQIGDAAERKTAEARRDELKRSFDHILQSARETREAFQPFLSGAHRISAKLETNPGLDSVNAARTLIADTQKAGHKTQEQLSDILAELNVVAAKLTPAAAEKK
jgi:hypothetical protein